MSRLKEPSTWAGLAVMGGLVVQFSAVAGPYAWLAVILGNVLTAVGGGAAIGLRDKVSAKPATAAVDPQGAVHMTLSGSGGGRTRDAEAP
jgi:hypothetical protein